MFWEEITSRIISNLWRKNVDYNIEEIYERNYDLKWRCWWSFDGKFNWLIVFWLISEDSKIQNEKKKEINKKESNIDNWDKNKEK